MSSLAPSTTIASPSSSPCRILIADDHPIFRSAAKCLLEHVSWFKIVAEAEDGEQALARMAEFKPDVAVVDVSMPGLSGVEVIRRASSLCPATRIVAVTAFEEGGAARDTLAAGAAGFVPKSAAAAELIAAIQAVAAGGHYVPSGVVEKLLEAAWLDRSGRRSLLSLREEDVLRLVALGYSNKEMASHLAVSVKTIETYKARAMDKIGARTRVEVVRFAAKRGWLENAVL